MKGLNFIDARERAISHLSRFYNIQMIETTEGSVSQVSSYRLELEILKNNRTISVNLIILIQSDFPLSLPVVFLSTADIPTLGFLPNISTNGQICIFDTNSNIPNPEAPENVLEVCVKKARKLIEDGLHSTNPDKYNNEFIAYWENKFEDEEEVDTNVLSLISQNDKPPSSVNYVTFEPSIAAFSKLIYSEPEQFDRLKKYFNKTTLRVTSTFHLGQLDIWPPPYHMSNKDALELIRKRGLENKFIEYLKSKPLQPIVTFARVIDSSVLIFGWRHKPVQLITHRRGGKFVQLERPLRQIHFDKLLESQNSSVLTQRFSPQIFDHDRSTRRTAADYKDNRTNAIKKVMIAGLGSIGSNLIPFLEKSGVTEYRLVDDETLSLDNIGRHFLGINDTGRKKTKALQEYLEKKNPLTTVHTREQRIVQLTQKEPAFLTACDFHLFCTGDTNSESWLAENILDSEWKRPSLFIWVEPYLAGGHCVYFNGVDALAWNSIFPNGRFSYNVISDETHEKTSFLKREAGCQVTFLPYSASNLQLFIAALFPKILEVFKKRGKNKIVSWIGDLSIIKEMKIDVSEHVRNAQSFSLIERQL
jgi:hypothetical protein